jgi:integrase
MVDIEPRILVADGGAALARREALTARAYELARGSRASSTWAAYTRQWARFEAWCAEAGECPLPAAPLTVARFLADLAPMWRPATPVDPAATVTDGHVVTRPGLRPGTLAGYLAAISVAHTSAGHPNPAADESVRRVMAGLRRHPGLAPVTRRAAARRDQIAAICAAMNPDELLADARDTALILIGWKAALRASDLAGMRLQDQRVTDDGLAVHLRRSKTDQNATGATIGITPSAGDVTARASESGNPVSKPTSVGGSGRDAQTAPLAASPAVSLDAVAAWLRWRALLSSHGIVEGPAWRGIDRYGRRPRERGLTRDSVRLIIVRRADAAGLDPAAWGAHSLRRGFATEAIARGVPDRDVQRHGRWKSRTSMDPNIDDATTFDTTNPTRWLD